MLKYLYLNNFRNYENLEFKPDEKFIIFTGANGTGKSNLRKHLLSGNWLLFSSGRDDNLVASGPAILRSVGSSLVQVWTIRLMFSTKKKRKKTIKINNKRVLPGVCSSYLPVVIFSPQDLLLIKGAPQEGALS